MDKGDKSRSANACGERKYIVDRVRKTVDEDVELITRCIKRGQPMGDKVWVKKTAARLGLETTLRPKREAEKMYRTQ